MKRLLVILAAIFFLPLSALASTITFGASGHNSENWNDGNSPTKFAQSFTAVGGDYTAVTASMKKFPTTGTAKTHTWSIQADSSGAPSGTNLVSWTVVDADLTGSFANVTKTFSSTALTDGATYWIVIDNESGTNPSPNIFYETDDTNPYAGGKWEFLNGTWQEDGAIHVDMVGSITYTASGGATSAPFLGWFWSWWW